LRSTQPSLIISNGNLSETDAEVMIVTAEFTPESAEEIILYLEREGFIALSKEAA
jgi:hypothetical protein